MQTYPSLLAVDRTSGAPLAGCVVEVLDAETMASVTTYLDGVPRPVVTGAHGTTPVFQTEDSTRRVFMRVPSSDWRAHVWSQEALGTADDARLAAAAQADRAQAAATEATGAADDARESAAEARALLAAPAPVIPPKSLAVLSGEVGVGGLTLSRSGAVVVLHANFSRTKNDSAVRSLAALPDWAAPQLGVFPACLTTAGNTLSVVFGSVRLTDPSASSSTNVRANLTWLTGADWPTSKVLADTAAPYVGGLAKATETKNSAGTAYLVTFDFLSVRDGVALSTSPYSVTAAETPSTWTANSRNLSVTVPLGETRTVYGFVRDANGNVTRVQTTYTAPAA